MGERNWRGILTAQTGTLSMCNLVRSLFLGSTLAVVLLVVNIFVGNVPWWTLHGYIIVGLSISFVEWGAERLWQRTIGLMMPDAFSLMSYATRLPFWYFAGGVGYTVVLLCCKRFGIMGAYDTPVRDMFNVGAWAGIVSQLLIHLVSRTAYTNRTP